MLTAGSRATTRGLSFKSFPPFSPHLWRKELDEGHDDFDTAIEADPWNAVVLEWPADADRVFMEAAYRAAKRCAVIEFDLLIAAREGRHIPEGWMVREEESPDIHEYNEARWLQAEQHKEFIAECYREAFQAEIDPPQ